MLFVCGDTHGGEDGDMLKLGSKRFNARVSKNVSLKFTTKGNKFAPNLFKVKTNKNQTVDLFMNKLNQLVVLGDFGMVWSEPSSKFFKTEMNYLNTLANKEFQVCFLDGNHDNHDLLAKLPVIDFFGGKAGVAFENENGQVLHLKRGEVFNFNGKKVLVMGGAASADTNKRTEGLNWWKNEVFSEEDKQNTLKNLSKHNFEVDFVLSHNAPHFVGQLLRDQVIVPEAQPYSFMNREYDRALDNKLKYDFKSKDENAMFFQELLDKFNLKFKEWHFGHFHQDKKINDKFHLHFNKPPFQVF